jgi:hypothetical protein
MVQEIGHANPDNAREETQQSVDRRPIALQPRARVTEPPRCGTRDGMSADKTPRYFAPYRTLMKQFSGKMCETLDGRGKTNDGGQFKFRGTTFWLASIP